MNKKKLKAFIPRKPVATKCNKAHKSKKEYSRKVGKKVNLDD